MRLPELGSELGFLTFSRGFLIRDSKRLNNIVEVYVEEFGSYIRIG